MTKHTMKYGATTGFHEQSASILLLLLLLADLVFIALHTIEFMSPSLNNALLSLEKDQGFPEVYQYIKWFWIITLLALISIARRSVSYGAWCLFFTYLLLDDALEMHENLGVLITGHLAMTPPFGLRVQDLGELVVAGIMGVVVLLLVYWGYRYGSKAFRTISIDMLLLIMGLAFFGVIVDTVHVMAHMSSDIGWKVSAILAVIEDGGEMIVVSIILWYAFLHCVKNNYSNLSLFEYMRSILIKRSS